MAGLLERIRDRLPVSRATLAGIQHENATLTMRLKAAQGSAVASGVDIDWGKFSYEHNELLRGSKRWLTLDRMEADPHIKGALRAMILPLQNADWTITAASDDDRDQEIRDFVACNLLRQSNDRFGREYWVETPWEAQRLPEALQMLRDGFSAHAISFRPVGTKRVYNRIQWLEPSTIDGLEPWTLDNTDNILQLNRSLSTPQGHFTQESPVLVDDLALFVWDLKGARYEGRSFLRSLYGAWFRKEFIQRMGAIWAQKSGAPMPIGTYPKEWSSTDRALFEEAVRSARGTSPAEAYFVGPSGSDGKGATIEWAGAENDIERGLTSLIEAENAEIAHGASSKSMLLGETSSGSRALGESQGGDEKLQVQAVAKIMCSQLAHGVGNVPGLIERLVDMNYPNVEHYPEAACSRIDPDEGLEHLEKLLKATAAGILPKHENVRRAVADMFRIELPDEAFEVEEPPAGLVPFVPGQPPPAADPQPDQAEARASLASKRAAIEERIRPLLQPIKEGRPRSGGRFPE